MDRDKENIEVKTPKTKQFQAIQRTIMPYFSPFSLTSYNANKGFWRYSTDFPKAKVHKRN